MKMPEEDLTRLVLQLREGNREDFDRLLERVYPDLRAIAVGQLRNQRPDHTFTPTALVHEAYLRLVRYREVDWKGRAHFFGAVSRTMRRVLVDYARARTAEKRGGSKVAVSLSGVDRPDSEGMALEELIAIDEALDRLSEHRPRWVRVVECRFFSGLTIEETAEALGISHGTVSNDWRLARAWLRKELDD